MHEHCSRNDQTSEMPQAQKDICPQCREEKPSTEEEIVKQVRVWVEKGKSWAQTILASIYRHGNGVPQSYEKAIEYYTMAIKQGDPNAMYQLARMYDQGQGVAKSLKKSAELLALAAKQGHAGARCNLGFAYEKGTGVVQSYKKAFGLYTLAANQGIVSAQFNLGNLYIRGRGVVQSIAMAREWWLKAALQEDENAIKNLKLLDEHEGKTTPTLPCCAVCDTPKTTKRPLHACSQCHTTHYCNRECQMKHWKEGGHKRECKQLQKEHEEKEKARGGEK
jgi:TPR repeat protein